MGEVPCQTPATSTGLKSMSLRGGAVGAVESPIKLSQSTKEGGA